MSICHKCNLSFMIYHLIVDHYILMIAVNPILLSNYFLLSAFTCWEHFRFAVVFAVFLNILATLHSIWSIRDFVPDFSTGNLLFFPQIQYWCLLSRLLFFLPKNPWNKSNEALPQSYSLNTHNIIGLMQCELPPG